MPKIALSDEIIRNLHTSFKQEDFYDSNFTLKGSFGVRLGQGKRKTFFLICTKDGKRIRTSLGQFPSVSYKDALKLAFETVESSDVEHNSPRTSGALLSEVSSLFIKKSILDGLSNTTLKEYERLLGREILPKLGNFEIQKIKLGDFQKLFVAIALERNKVPLSNRVRSLLCRIMNFSIEMGYRVRNPIASTRPLIESRSDKTLGLSEVRTLFSHLSEKDSVVSLGVLLSILLIKDIRAVLNLQWSNLRGFTILFREGDKTREIPLTESMLDIIEKQRKRGVHDNIYVFTSKRGGKIKFFEKTLNKLGLESSVSPCLSASIIYKSINIILENLLKESKADPELISAWEAINQQTNLSPKDHISLLLRWESILKGSADAFISSRSTKASGQLIMIPQSWWKKG